MTESLVLYIESSWSSPWFCTVFVTMREKVLPFTTALSMMRKGQGAIDAMRDRTLTGTAPVLQHGAFWLAESLAIVEYLEEVFPDVPMLPVDVRDRARARQLMTWMRNEHEALRRERPSERIVYSSIDVPPLSAAARANAEDLVRVADKLGADSRGCLFGGRFGAVDVELAFSLMRLIATGFVVPEAIGAYAKTVWKLPSVREFIEHARPPNPPV